MKEFQHAIIKQNFNSENMECVQYIHMLLIMFCSRTDYINVKFLVLNNLISII